jgi:hypothetical protein
MKVTNGFVCLGQERTVRCLINGNLVLASPIKVCGFLY